MNNDTLRLIRNILLRTVVVIFVFNIFTLLITLSLWDTWLKMTCDMFHTTAEAATPVILSFFTTVKFFTIYVLLAPALALHWTIKSSRSKQA